MEQVAWIAVQAALAAASGFGIAALCRVFGYEPSYMDAPKFYGLCCGLGLVLVSLPFTFAVTHFAPILKEKQRAARRRKTERADADISHDLDRRRLGRLHDRR